MYFLFCVRSSIFFPEIPYTRQILAWFESLLKDGSISSDIRLEIVTKCLIHSGNKSTSHCRKVLSRYKDVLVEVMSATEGGLMKMLHSVFEYWRNSSLRIQIVSELLISEGIVTAADIASWILSDDFFSAHTESWLWSFLRLIIDRAAPETRHALVITVCEVCGL